METYALPDGRLPIRFSKRRAAYYLRSDGRGEVRYTFSEIKYMQRNRPKVPSRIRSMIAVKRRDTLLEKDPDFYRKIGSKGGKNKKNERKHSSNT